jgi:hypothetical protein
MWRDVPKLSDESPTENAKGHQETFAPERVPKTEVLRGKPAERTYTAADSLDQRLQCGRPRVFFPLQRDRSGFVCSMCAKRIAVRGSLKIACAPCSVLASRKQAVGSTDGTAFEADMVAYNSEAARDGIVPSTPAFSGL